MEWKASQTTEKARLQSYLETDRPYAAYAIGDLEPERFDQGPWAIAEASGKIGACALYFRGLKVPMLFLMGDNDGVRAILSNQLRPNRAFIGCRTEHSSVVEEFYTWKDHSQNWRMVLTWISQIDPSGDWRSCDYYEYSDY